MIKHKKGLIQVFLCFLLFNSAISFSLTGRAGAEEPSIKSNPIGPISDWKLDEENGLIYAISDRKVLFIGIHDLKVKKELPVQGDISDAELFKGKLYLATSYNLTIINVAANIIERTIPLGVKAVDIAVEDNTIFYVKDSQWQKVYEVNLATEKTTEIKIAGDEGKSYYTPAIAIDPNKHILYIGESGLSGSHIEAIRTNDYQRLSRSTYDNGYGFPYPEREVIFDAGEVFYAGHRLDGQHMDIIHGSYNGHVRQVYGNFVFTEKSVYDRGTFIELPAAFAGDILLDRNHNAYIYTENQTIEKVKWDVPVDEGGEYFESVGELAFYCALSDWVYDREHNYIYAVSKDNNRLYYIRGGDLTVEHELPIGSNPTDIEYWNGKLYVALNGATKVAVTEASYTGKVEQIILDRNPFRIEVGGNKIFYVSTAQHQAAHAYDLSTGSITKGIVYAYRQELLLDREKQVLYIGESGSSGSHLYALNAGDLTIKDKDNFDNGYGFPYPKQKLVKKGDLLFYDRFAVDANNLSMVRDDYEFEEVTEDFVDVIDDYVFSTDAVYDLNTHSMVSELPFSISMVEKGADGSYFIYGKEDQLIVKYDSISELLADWPILDENVRIEPPKEIFKYIPEDISGHWAMENLFDFVAADLLNGYEDEEGTVSLKPDAPITRAEFVTILVRALGLSGDKGAKAFHDVKPNDWFDIPVRVASAHGIVNGVDETRFAPNSPIKRDEIAAILVRAFESSIHFTGKPKSFKDVPTYWATQAINKASSVGIIGGVTADEFQPFVYAKRAEAAVMLYRALHLETSELPSDKALQDAVIAFEKEMNEAFNAKQLDQAKAVIDKYTTGYNELHSIWNFNVVEAIMKNGVDLKSTLQGNLSAVVIDKSNRFAAVELKGAVYENEYRKGELTRKTVQDTSGVIYMKKMPDDVTWKIYNVFSPNFQEY